MVRDRARIWRKLVNRVTAWKIAFILQCTLLGVLITNQSLCVSYIRILTQCPAARSTPNHIKQPVRASFLANSIANSAANPTAGPISLVLVFLMIITVTLSPSRSTRRLLRRSTCDILPSSAKPPPRASKEALFFIFLGVLIGLELVHFRCAEESGDEDEKEYG